LDKLRGTASQRGYDAAWRKVREQFIAAHPWCCEPGCGKPAKDVDHIVSIRERPDLRLHWSNLRSFCHPHHSARTSREQSWNHTGVVKG
jgi:5-methylcytosine-specific restriction endonuclease McrA